MRKGKWYLVYSLKDNLGSGLGGTWEDEEIPLKATVEGKAVAEAKLMWGKRVVEANASWEVQKKKWVHPPASPFTDGPTNPRVIYKISLQ